MSSKIFRKYNSDTLVAFQEAEKIRKHPEKYKSYSSAEAMFKDILFEAAKDPGFKERCEEITKDFATIDYLKENFERNEEKS